MTEETATPVADALTAAVAPPPSGDYQRTLAETRASAMLAHQFPRDRDRCLADMRFSCSQLSVAEEAFFVLKGERNGKLKVITGSTVHLARELARCWRNIDYGAIEVARTDTHSQILTYAVDLETNARGSVQNIVQHMGRKTATEIYEHNASDASRRLREIIFNILPAWFVAEAENLCRATLAQQFNAIAVDSVVQRLKDLGISLERIENEVGRKFAGWGPLDLANLVIKARTIERGDMRADDVFETSVADEIVRELTAAGGKPKTAAAHARQVEEPKPDAEKPKRKSRAKTAETPIQVPTGGTAEGGAIYRAEPSEGRPVEREGAAPHNSGDDGGNRPAKPAATPPPSIASLGASQGRSAIEPTPEPSKAPETPVKRGRGRPPKAKPEAVEGAKDVQPAPQQPSAPKQGAKARLDLNGSPDADEDPESFLIYWMNRIRVVPAEQEPLAVEMDKFVSKKIKDLKSLLIKWKSAVDLRLKKIARAAELAKAH